MLVKATNKRCSLNYSNIFCSEESSGKNSSAGVGTASGRGECQTPQQRNSRLQESTEWANAAQRAWQNWSVKEKSRLVAVGNTEHWCGCNLAFTSAWSCSSWLCSVSLLCSEAWSFEAVVLKANLFWGVCCGYELIQHRLSFRWAFPCLFLKCPKNVKKQPLRAAL